MTCTADCHLSTHRTLLVESPPAVDLDGSTYFRLGWAAAVPARPGVYLIHDIRGPVYIGRAENLRRRVEEHYLNSHNPAVRRAIRRPVGRLLFSWALVAAPEQGEFERTLIKSLRPLCNVQHNSGSRR